MDTEASIQNQAIVMSSKASLFRSSLPGFIVAPALSAIPMAADAVQQGDVWVAEQPIRPDWAWSDGTPVTAGDLVFYFDTVREFDLGPGHAEMFPPEVLAMTAPDDHTVRIEFAGQPGLATWYGGVAFAPFVPRHFWEERVDEARTAADEVMSGITDTEARQGVVAASLADSDAGNDLSSGDVTPAQIDEYIADVGSSEGRSALFEVSGVNEPSIGPLKLTRWEPGEFAVTEANFDYFDNGTENTLYDDGSLRVANSARGEDVVYGGQGTGAVVSSYTEGPFVSEIIWVEHDSKSAAYESLASGELDYVLDPTGVAGSLREENAGNPDLQFSVSQTDGFRYLAFNLRKPPMSDAVFRDAVATVIDKEWVADTMLAGEVIPGYTIVHPDLVAHHNPDVVRPGWSDDAPLGQGERFEIAIQLLTDVGYTWDSPPIVQRDDSGNFVDVTPGEGLTMPNGVAVPELTLLTPGPRYDPLRATFAVSIEQWMNDLGIPVVAEPSDFDTVVDMVFPPQTPDTALGWDMYLLGWDGPDVSLPGTAMVAFFHSDEDAVEGGGFNTTGYQSAEFDAAADAFQAAGDLETAARLTREMEAIIARDLPYVVLFRTPIIEVFSSRVHFPVDAVMGGHAGFPRAWPAAVSVSG